MGPANYTAAYRAAFKKRVTLILLFFIMPVLFLNAQETNHTSYAVTNEGLQVFQTIIFPAVHDARKYEIEIELINDNGTTTFVEKIDTGENYVIVSLRAGFYRYKVFAYNRMTLLIGMSEWQEFMVFPIVEPVIDSYQPFYGLYYEMTDPDGTLIVHGSNFFSYSEFALVKKGSNINWLGVPLESRSDVIIPYRVKVTGNTASLNFSGGSLKQGVYEIFIRNPGGLWSVFGEVHVSRKRSDFTFSFGYSPMIAAFDIENSRINVWNDQTGSYRNIQQLDVFNPLGFYFRLGWLPSESKTHNFGLELELYFLSDNYDRFRYEQNNEPGLSRFFGSLKGASLDFLWQLHLTERWKHNIRFGAGINQLYNDFPNSNLIPLDINFGYSSQFFFLKNLFLEAGIKTQYTISFDKNFPLNHLSFFPSIALGWQFGRWFHYTEVAEGISRGEDYSVPVTQLPVSEHLISFGWSPMIPFSGFDLYGSGYGMYQGNDYRYFDEFNPIGFKMNYAYFPNRWGKNKLGIELDLFILEHKNRDKLVPFYINFALLSHAFFNIHYQRLLSDNWQINFRAGIGVSNTYEYRRQPGVAFAVNTGVSVQYFIWKDLFAEAGMDLIYIFFEDNLKTAIRPGISIGWQFNRNNETGFRLPGSPGHEETAAQNRLRHEALHAADDAYSSVRQLTHEKESEEEPAEIIEEPPKQLKILTGQSKKYNTLGLSIGTSFVDPLLVASINVSIAPFNYAFMELGFDLGFFSVYEDVEKYYSIYPFIKAGIFIPFQEKGGFFFSAGLGFMRGSYTFYSYGTANLNVFAYNFTAGVNIGNLFNISYTLKTDFNSASHMVSLGYVIRVE